METLFKITTDGIGKIFLVDGADRVIAETDQVDDDEGLADWAAVAIADAGFNHSYL